MRASKQAGHDIQTTVCVDSSWMTDSMQLSLSAALQTITKLRTCVNYHRYKNPLTAVPVITLKTKTITATFCCSLLLGFKVRGKKAKY